MPTVKAKITRSYSQLFKKDRFFRRPVHYSVIGTQELIRLAAQDSQLSISVVSQIFDGIRVQFNELLLNGHTVQLGDLGSFRMSISCKSASTAEEVSTDLLKTRRIIFLPSKELKTAIDSAKIKSEVGTYIESVSKTLPAKVGDLKDVIITLNKKVSMRGVGEHLTVFFYDDESKKNVRGTFNPESNSIDYYTDTMFTVKQAKDNQLRLETTFSAGQGPSVPRISWQ